MSATATVPYIALLIALCSLFISLQTYLVSRQRTWAQIIFQIVDRLETEDMRDIRHNVIYQYPRQSADGWAAKGKTAEETQAAINRWGAEMDLLALLLFTKQLNKGRFFDFYGDVLIRSAYRLAPHANRERILRGEQFWLLYQQLTCELLRLWRDLVQKHRYPERIGIPGSGEPMTLGELRNDPEFRRFLLANNQRIPDLT